MTTLAYSSEIYYIKAKDLKKLSPKNETGLKTSDAEAVILLNEEQNFLIFGKEKLQNTPDESFVKTRIAYETYSPFLGFFINLIKPLKRKLYIQNKESYTVLFKELLAANITRGERTAANAYQWHNKKWQISKEEAKSRYDSLYQSLKQHGYDQNNPLLITLNRKFGIKDQVLQGHHRIGICKELGITEVNVAFWAAPVSFGFFKVFISKRKKR